MNQKNAAPAAATAARTKSPSIATSKLPPPKSMTPLLPPPYPYEPYCLVPRPKSTRLGGRLSFHFENINDFDPRILSKDI